MSGQISDLPRKRRDPQGEFYSPFLQILLHSITRAACVQQNPNQDSIKLSAARHLGKNPFYRYALRQITTQQQRQQMQATNTGLWGEIDVHQTTRTVAEVLG